MNKQMPNPSTEATLLKAKSTKQTTGCNSLSLWSYQQVKECISSALQCATLESHGLTKQKPSHALHANYIQRLQQLSHNTGAAEEDQ
jgi:hypothetical protein